MGNGGQTCPLKRPEPGKRAKNQAGRDQGHLQDAWEEEEIQCEVPTGSHKENHAK